MSENKTLVVDLDGTLIRTDLLYESLWSALSTNASNGLGVLPHLLKGRASLKDYLAQKVDIDPTQLPYNQNVLKLISERKANGDHIVLATASHERFARKIADHLGIFDEVHGSTAQKNIKGHAKAELLNEKFGARGYDYAGDSRADLAIWEHADNAITVNLRDGMKKRVENKCKNVQHISPEPRALSYFKAMRPHQWLKNLLIFLPPLLAHEANWQIWSLAIMAFTAFSLIASGVYLLNDMMDLSSDRAHPRKKERPFASGAVPLLHGMIMAPLLLLLGLFVGLATGSLNFLIILVIYVALTTGYSVYFKRKLVLDITMLASLYTIRIVAGALATGLTISVWLAAFSIFIFFSLAAIKRQTELVGNARAGKGKILGRAYSPDDLPIITMMAVAAGYVAVMVMALYINAQADQGLYQTPEYLWGICLLLLYWISRAVLLSHRGEMHDDPIVFAVRDRTSRITAITIASLMAAGTFL